MSDILFTADNHFNHANIIKYSNRPFKNVNEMRETMIANWNAKVKYNSTIYILGDVGFGDLEPILKRLNGDKILIVGSHDKDALKYPQYFKRIEHLLDIVVEDQPITLCHYAMRTWKKSHFNSWHLFAHSHGRLESFGKSFDVGVDAHNFYPLSFEEVKKIMDKLPDNFNLVKKEQI